MNVAHGLATALANQFLVDQSERARADAAEVLVCRVLHRRYHAEAETGVVASRVGVRVAV